LLKVDNLEKNLAILPIGYFERFFVVNQEALQRLRMPYERMAFPGKTKIPYFDFLRFHYSQLKDFTHFFEPENTLGKFGYSELPNFDTYREVYF